LHEEKVHDVDYDHIWSMIAQNDIYIYLSSLVEDLKMLCVDGVEIFDVFASKTFIMCAMLFCIINDFPTYGNL